MNLAEWYSKGFWLATYSLVLWHNSRNHEGWTKLFQLGLVLGFTSYAISFSFLPLTAGTKLIILFKDLLTLGVISSIFHALRDYKKIYWLAIILLYAFSKLFLGQWQKSFLQQSSTSFQSQPENEWEILIQLDNHQDKSAIQPVLDKYHLIAESSFELNETDATDLDNYYSIEIPENIEDQITDIKTELSLCKHVIWIEDNEVINIDPLENNEVSDNKTPFKSLTNDPYTTQQWSIESLGWNQVMNLFKEGLLKPKKRAKIFILDTGVDGNHEDLKGNYESFNKGSDADDMGHGTHVAGIAGAVTNNALGISSVNPGPEFISVSSIKVLGKFGAGTQRDIINAILKAADAGADVINMSLGGRSLDSRQKAYNEAVEYANKKGTIIVVAAGNDNTDARNYAPANAKGVITVSAINEEMNKAPFSNFVNDIQYKIAAPGTNIYSCTPNNQYAAFNGTSMAAPFVTGLVALMKSIKPELNTREIYDILSTSGSESKNPDQTGKVIHAGRAIEQLVQASKDDLR
ncbi:MAG: S8 family serine peptidase [Saprospiraceae bacterium]